MAVVGDNTTNSNPREDFILDSKVNYYNELKTSVDDGNDYNLPLQDVYKLALRFYKDKEGKAVYLSYEDKLQLIAFTQQVLHGSFNEASKTLAPLGALDVVGKDRRIAWAKLGNLTSDEARSGFVELLSRRCSLFTTYIEAHRREQREQARITEELEKRRECERQKHKEEELVEEIKRNQLEREESIKRQIQTALNEQTYEQFRKYAEQQYLGDVEKQSELVKQLQQQHYIQYIQQLQQHNQQPIKEAVATEEEKGNNLADDPVVAVGVNCDNEDDDEEEEEEEEDNGGSPVTVASMWTRDDIAAFKQVVEEGEGDGVVRVGHGETVTVRVPTHRDGSRLFWEFATDDYDIGFGVYFEYGTPTSEQVSVHVSESDDDDDDEDDVDELEDEDDLEAAAAMATTTTSSSSANPVTEIIPVYRRDCQLEVYAGSHQYPALGVYLLKFDNSYSLWRSKTLYYRVYYTHQ